MCSLTSPANQEAPQSFTKGRGLSRVLYPDMHFRSSGTSRLLTPPIREHTFRRPKEPLGRRSTNGGVGPRPGELGRGPASIHGAIRSRFRRPASRSRWKQKTTTHVQQIVSSSTVGLAYVVVAVAVCVRPRVFCFSLQELIRNPHTRSVLCGKLLRHARSAQHRETPTTHHVLLRATRLVRIRCLRTTVQPARCSWRDKANFFCKHGAAGLKKKKQGRVAPSLVYTTKHRIVSLVSQKFPSRALQRLCMVY